MSTRQLAELSKPGRQPAKSYNATLRMFREAIEM
jgi:hypothetical protein